MICYIADCQGVLIGEQEVIRRVGGRKEGRKEGEEGEERRGGRKEWGKDGRTNDSMD